MAIRRITILEDDLDGSDADEPVTFALDGKAYEIDLTDKHASDFAVGLAPLNGGWAERFPVADQRTFHSRREGGILGASPGFLDQVPIPRCAPPATSRDTPVM